MNQPGAAASLGWRGRLPEGVRPYVEAAPLAAAFLGVSSGFAFAMIAATLTTRLAQYGIRKSAVTAFALTFLAYNFKWLWAPLVDTVRLPVLGRFGQRRSWLWLVGVLVMAAVVFLGSLDPRTALPMVATAAILVGVLGATFDIVIDAYRIELLEPHQLGVGSGMSQYGWRIGSVTAGALALVIAARYGWAAAYAACALFALPAMLVGVVMGEPARRRPAPPPTGVVAAVIAYFSPLVEFVRRRGALVVLAFVLIHKIGDTLANLTLRLLFDQLRFTNDEIAFYDVGMGFVAYLVGIFVGGAMYASMGMKRSVLVEPDPDGRLEPQLRGAGGLRPQQHRDGRGHWLRELRQRHRRRRRRRLHVRPLQPAFHRHPVRAAVRAGQHRRPLPHRNHGRRAPRVDGLRQLLRADDAHRAAWRVPLLVHGALGACRRIDRNRRHERGVPATAVLDPHCGRLRRWRSSSSSVRGQSFFSSRERARSASRRPSVWHVAQ